MDRHHNKDFHRRHHRPSRIRRSVSIPRGFLDYGVLRALSREPMSGTELMDAIEDKTSWRPSPGSIYPLLKKLREEGSIEEVESDEPGLKRFTLTEKGSILLEEHRKRRDIFRKKYHSIRQMWLRIYEEMDDELYQANLKLLEAIEGISAMLKGENIRASEKVQSILKKAAEDIEEIKEHLKEE